MIKLENYEVMGWEHAIRGMRNPKNAWANIDSAFKGVAQTDILEDDGSVSKLDVYFDALNIGEKDHNRMMSLSKGGSVHAKYRRMITVYVDITAPLYWWKEFETYKVGTDCNSCSTMHTIHEKEFTLDDFSHEHLIGVSEDMGNVPFITGACGDCNDCGYTPSGILECWIIPMLNKCRDGFNEADEKLKTRELTDSERKHVAAQRKHFWWQMIQLLPSSYNQKRTIKFNYEVLANIYRWRKDHKLDEWREFCEWIKTLPYSEIITLEEK